LNQSTALIIVFTLQYTAPDTRTISNIIGLLLLIFFAKKYDESIRTNITKYSQIVSLFFERLTHKINASNSEPHLKFNIHSLFYALHGLFYKTPKTVLKFRIVLPLNSYRTKFGNELSLDTIYKSKFVDLPISQPDQLEQTLKEYHEEDIIPLFEEIINVFSELKKSQAEKILPLSASGIHMTKLLKVLKMPK
jgi:hypothetical protein